jgi:hypothetical protein
VAHKTRRTGDRRIIRLIQKWLKAGVLEDGRLIETTEGTPQGSVASPLLANVYLHYVYDLWVEQWRTRHARGDMIVARYADDTIVGFQHRQDAERFQIDLKELLATFALNLHPEKTRLLEFGRYAAERRAERGRGKPETFDFLGLTHYCTTRKDGTDFQLGRKTQRKRMKAKLREIKETLRRLRHTPIDEQGRWLGTMMKGLLRGADQHISAVGLPLSHQHNLVPKSAATQPAASADVGTDDPTYQAVPTVAARAAPVAKPSVPRQILEVGAECVSSARSDLCGGCQQWSSLPR